MGVLRLHVGSLALDVYASPGISSPTVLLLHGFPDSRHLWDAQVSALERAGFRVIAPSLPGFGASDRPADVAAYSMESLLRCMLALLDQLGVGKAHVVGHDWGASLAWYIAMKAPARVSRLVVLSVGHAGALFGGGGLRQREQSWYMLWFLAMPPAAVERALKANSWRLFRELFPVSSAELESYRAALEAPGTLAAGVNLYRANVRLESFGITGFPPFPKLTLPVMGVWSSGDPALTEGQMVESGRYVAPGLWRYERLEGCGHWIPREAPQRLNALLLDFLANPGPPAAKL